MALNKNLNTLSLDLEDFLEKGQESEPHSPSFHGLMLAYLQEVIRSLAETSEFHQSQETDAKHILKTSENNVQHFQKEIMDDLNENIHLQESLELLSLEYEEWKQRTHEPRVLLECSNTGMQQELNEKESHINSLVKTILTVPAPDRRSCRGRHLGSRGKEGHWIWTPPSPYIGSLS